MSKDAFTVVGEEHLLPTEAEVASYLQRGWYLSRKLFSDDEIDALVEASERFYSGQRDRELPARPRRLADWRPADGDVQRHNDYVHYLSDDIGRILNKPIIGAVAARLAEADEVRIFQSTLIYKPPRPDDRTNVVPWHFDKHYWRTCTSDRMLTAFIPFHDCDVRMGTITMVDGSQLWKEVGDDASTAQHFAQRDHGDLDRRLAENAEFNNAEVHKMPMTIPKGHMSFHHCRTYHGSGPNLADRPRRAVSLHLQDGDNAYQSFRQPDGTMVEYNHDTVVRRTERGLPDYADPDFCPVLWRAPR
ncbi:phytanoyl-CoA dioxygenase family protein [Catenulispora pinisilvae]|uniref:phytanoyl-CoA dioxygenase family protein n=1 Tax=Catenulispora pinisilvae TaxID=2705253 RepID=UPI0018912A15|nr:phytanoyl-CoA dioxygenase family protein [Catenulispora pinisilvae]